MLKRLREDGTGISRIGLRDSPPTSFSFAPQATWSRDEDACSKKENPARGYLAGFIKSAITYFPAEQYHRLQELNFCVRDGNRCDPLHMVTDKSERGFPAALGRVQMSFESHKKRAQRRLRTDQTSQP